MKITLKGRRVLLDIPEIKQPSIKLTDAAQAEYEKGVFEKLRVLTVYQAGDGCETTKNGMKVYLSPASLQNKVPVGDDFKFLISESEIIYIYED